MLSIGAADDIKAIQAQYPEKSWPLLLATVSAVYAGIKGRIKRFVGLLI